VAFASHLQVPIWTMGRCGNCSAMSGPGKGEHAHTVLATAFEEIIGRRFSDWN